MRRIIASPLGTPVTLSMLARRAGTIALWGALGVALLTASAKIEVPFWPVPMTLETFAALALGGFLGARLAGGSVLAWLALGFAGLPVFAGPIAGPAYFAGPTGGYLIGLFAAALFVGRMTERATVLRPMLRPLLVFAVMLVGIAIVYLLGASYLALSIGPERAIALGVAPFLLGDLTKAALAAALVLLGGPAALRRF